MDEDTMGWCDRCLIDSDLDLCDGCFDDLMDEWEDDWL